MQKAIQYFWWLSLAACLVVIVFFPEVISIEKIQKTVEGNFWFSVFIYFVLCTLRALTLVPATTFFLAGMFLFPMNYWVVYITMILTVMFSSWVHYHYAHILGFDTFFKKRFPHKMDRVKKILNHEKTGFWVVFFWGITPVVPSDLMYYVAGITQMNKRIFFSAIFFAVVSLFGVYILFWNGLKTLLLP